MLILNYIHLPLLKVSNLTEKLPDININWAIWIPSFISILGFLITYHLTNKNLKDEIKKFKKTMMIENSKEILEELVTFIDSTKKNNFTNVKYINEFSHKVYAFGSSDLIKIYAAYRQSNYKIEREKNNANEINNETKNNTTLPLAYFSLMITQTKFDFTGEITPPTEIFKIWLYDYETIAGAKDSIIKNINKLVNELNLNVNFKV